MIAIGIDPGVGTSHVAVVRDDSTFVTLNFYTLPTDPCDPSRLWASATSLAKSVQPIAYDAPSLFVVVESARGEVFKGRSADAVLQNNLVAGQLMGAFAPHCPVVTMPPSGQQLGFNWRDYLLTSHKDADAALKLKLSTLLTGEPLPTGARGAHNSHYADAAGIAVAALMRCRDKRITTPEGLAAFYAPSGLEAAQQAGVKSRRAERKTTRRVKGAADGRF